jgi:hypothetical protein
MSCDCQKFLDVQIRAIKGELNGMALIGVKPMWNSLISRLEQLQHDLKAHAEECETERQLTAGLDTLTTKQ